jgi:hypothetical protein
VVEVSPGACAVCRERRSAVGALCEACAETLAGGVAIAPQQLQPRTEGNGNAALIDLWGHAHPLDAVTRVGRADLPRGLVLVEASVSRAHAVVEVDQGVWRVRDVGSSSGTFVNDKPIGVAALRHGDKVRFGDIEMFFVVTAVPLPPRPEHIDIPTMRAPKGTEPPRSKRPTVPFSLQVPRGGGAGVAVIAGKQVALTTPQYELMSLLAARMISDAGKPDDERGYVPMAELLKLSLDVPDPGEDHVRQLVRRVRKALLKAELGDLIEAKRGVGYRLRVIPAG